MIIKSLKDVPSLIRASSSESTFLLPSVSQVSAATQTRGASPLPLIDYPYVEVYQLHLPMTSFLIEITLTGIRVEEFALEKLEVCRLPHRFNKLKG
jgi:hypothetical protein